MAQYEDIDKNLYIKNTRHKKIYATHENDLDNWVRGNAQLAQGLVVELVAKLVAASSPKPRDRRFPLGDSIGQHGPDGYLDAIVSHLPFVPEGKSFWEIGTSEGW